MVNGPELYLNYFKCDLVEGQIEHLNSVCNAVYGKTMQNNFKRT